MAGNSRVADFESPPLEEVVLGVQFSPPPSLNTVHARDVWNLYATEFPLVQEQPRLQPQFEVFGGLPPQGPQFNLSFGGPDLRNRLWFVAKDDSHLLQYQDDRLLLNWRKRTSGQEYPRHEGMAALFNEYLHRLSGYFGEAHNTPMAITQAEVTYVNVIPIERTSDVGDWISIFSFPPLEIEGINMSFSEVVYSETRQPVARIVHEFQTLLSNDLRKKAVRWAITYRGKPPKDNIDSALDFLAYGRELIVKRFCEITTKTAHEHWGRRK